MVTRRIRTNDRDEVDEVHDQYYRDNYYNSDKASNWLPLLMIPLFIVGLLAVFPYLAGNSNNIQNNTAQPGTNTQPDNTESNPQFGVGGGPENPTITPTTTPRPTSTTTPLNEPMDLETTREPTP